MQLRATQTDRQREREKPVGRVLWFTRVTTRETALLN